MNEKKGFPLSHQSLKRKRRWWRNDWRWSNEWWNYKRRKDNKNWPLAMTVKLCGEVLQLRNRLRATLTWYSLSIGPYNLIYPQQPWFLKTINLLEQLHLRDLINQQVQVLLWWIKKFNNLCKNQTVQLLLHLKSNLSPHQPLSLQKTQINFKAHRPQIKL